jgi:antitoxin MazE
LRRLAGADFRVSWFVPDSLPRKRLIGAWRGAALRALHGSHHLRLEFPIERIYNVETYHPGGIVMETTIRKWGNSPAVRLPAAILREAAFGVEQRVNISVSQGRIVIEPSDRVTYDLDALVDGITAGNRHEEADFGAPVGKEIW